MTTSSRKAKALLLSELQSRGFTKSSVLYIRARGDIHDAVHLEYLERAGRDLVIVRVGVSSVPLRAKCKGEARSNGDRAPLDGSSGEYELSETGVQDVLCAFDRYFEPYCARIKTTEELLEMIEHYPRFNTHSKEHRSWLRNVWKGMDPASNPAPAPLLQKAATAALRGLFGLRPRAAELPSGAPDDPKERERLKTRIRKEAKLRGFIWKSGAWIRSRGEVEDHAHFGYHEKGGRWWIEVRTGVGSIPLTMRQWKVSAEEASGWDCEYTAPLVWVLGDGRDRPNGFELSESGVTELIHTLDTYFEPYCANIRSTDELLDMMDRYPRYHTSSKDRVQWLRQVWAGMDPEKNPPPVSQVPMAVASAIKTVAKQLGGTVSVTVPRHYDAESAERLKKMLSDTD